MEISIEVPQRKINLPSDPAIPFLGIYLKEYTHKRGTCVHAFVVEFFTIAKVWNPPRCPTANEWIKKIWYLSIYLPTYLPIMEYYSAIKEYGLYVICKNWRSSC
jgi:hypothetical protein